MDTKNNNSTITPAETAIMSAGGIFSLICIILKNYPLFFAGFGVCMITMGVSFFRAAKHPLDFPLIMSATPVIGAVMIGLPILNAAGVMDIEYDTKFLLNILTAAFAVFGVSFLISPPINRASKIRRCTQAVTAVCVDVNTSTSGKTGTMYCPVWEYTAGGSTYSYSSGIYSTGDKTQTGDTTELMVNPNDPKDAYVSSRSFNMLSYLVGAIFTAAAVMLFIFFK